MRKHKETSLLRLVGFLIKYLLTPVSRWWKLICLRVTLGRDFDNRVTNALIGGSCLWNEGKMELFFIDSILRTIS